MSPAPTIHADCVVVGEAGVLIRGASGSGKSSLSLALVERAGEQGLFAALVADDRVRVAAVNGRLIASPHPAIAGLVERRGVGIVAAPFVAAAVVRLVIDIVDAPERTPSDEALRTEVAGVGLARLQIARGDPNGASLALFGVHTCFSGASSGRSALAFAPQHEKIASSAPHAPFIRPDRAGVARGGHDPERNEFCAENA